MRRVLNTKEHNHNKEKKLLFYGMDETNAKYRQITCKINFTEESLYNLKMKLITGKP